MAKVWRKYGDGVTMVRRRYDEHIAICLDIFSSGLVRSDDGMVNLCNYFIDNFFVYSGIAHDLDEPPGWRVFQTFYDAATKVWRRYNEHIAICLKAFNFGLMMSDDGMMDVGNYTIDFCFCR